jgi:hypothetical protein
MFKKPAGFLLAVAACASIVVVALRPIAAADACLIVPRNETPKGQHWYHRIERGTGRQCWYLRQDDASSSPAAATSVPLPVERPLIGENAIATSIADAHDELPQPQVHAEDSGQMPASAPDSSVVAGQDVQNVAPAPKQQIMSVSSDATPLPSAPAEPPISVKMFMAMVFCALALCELGASTLFPLWRTRGRPQSRPNVRRESDRPRSRLVDPVLSPRPAAPARSAVDRFRQPVDRDDRLRQVERLLAQLADQRRPPVRTYESQGRRRAAL